MGGGGAMRSAAKIAGIGVGRSKHVASASAKATDQPVWNAQKTTPAALSSQGVKAAEVAMLHTTPSWDMNDWDFADGGDLVMEAGEPMPRVVFDSVPSFQEAKEATDELKDAIDKIYLSSDSSQCEGSSPSSQVSDLSPTSGSETKSRVIEAISSPSVPRHALQAFQFLSANSEAQTVVASIACDPNVWNAVMKNSAVNSFIQSRQKAGENAEMEESAEGAPFISSEAEETCQKMKEELPSGNDIFDFMGFLQNLKLTVTEMVCKVSHYLQNLFPIAENEKSSADGSSNESFMDNKVMGGTLMGLAMMVIIVVLTKRA